MFQSSANLRQWIRRRTIRIGEWRKIAPILGACVVGLLDLGCATRETHTTRTTVALEDIVVFENRRLILDNMRFGLRVGLGRCGRRHCVIPSVANRDAVPDETATMLTNPHRIAERKPIRAILLVEYPPSHDAIAP